MRERPLQAVPNSAETPALAPSRDLFGSAAVRLGISSAGDVMRALAEQRVRTARGGRRPKLGMLMRQMGLLTRDQLWRVLEHLRWNPLAPSDDAIQIASRLRARHTEKANVIVVSACAEGDGASIAAAQIAAALALMDAGSVLLVDANLRNATLHTWFSAPLVPGLTDLIQGTSSAGVQPAPGASGLRLLPAGNLAVDAVSLLMSERCVATLESLRRVYDWIILDAPPMLLHPDAVVLASRANGVVAVVAAGRGRKSELREMQRVAEGVGVGLSGVVVTEQTQRFSQRRLPWLGALRRRP